MLKALFLGFPVGVAFGYALQRGRFCMNTAFRDVLLIRDTTLVRTWVLALLIQMVGVQAMAGLGWFQMGMAPFWWQAALLGGLVFGWGMALSGG